MLRTAPEVCRVFINLPHHVSCCLRKTRSEVKAGLCRTSCPRAGKRVQTPRKERIGSLIILLVTCTSKMTSLLVGIDFMLIVLRYIQVSPKQMVAIEKNHCICRNKQEPCSNSQRYNSLESTDWLLQSCSSMQYTCSRQRELFLGTIPA